MSYGMHLAMEVKKIQFLSEFKVLDGHPLNWPKETDEHYYQAWCWIY